MTQGRIGLVQELFERWNAGRDPLWFVENSQPGVEIFSRYAEVEGQPFVGAVGVQRWIREINESFEVYDAHADDLREVGDSVLALGSVRFRGRGSGIEMEQEMGWVFDFQDGKFSQMLFYDTHAEALKAVEAREVRD